MSGVDCPCCSRRCRNRACCMSMSINPLGSLAGSKRPLGASGCACVPSVGSPRVKGLHWSRLPAWSGPLAKILALFSPGCVSREPPKGPLDETSLPLGASGGLARSPSARTSPEEEDFDQPSPGRWESSPKSSLFGSECLISPCFVVLQGGNEDFTGVIGRL